ncbi:glycosylated lysosomal membrane protein [Strigops habroptila]|uniref:glycosylated lysosomal membrane protein n=1 Tax=Strigops habroptila TaxID=2489341 RepID=UPI00140250CA|nr:glycosylated lysosomal membrane protein [Strigops habroptila]
MTAEFSGRGRVAATSPCHLLQHSETAPRWEFVLAGVAPRSNSSRFVLEVAAVEEPGVAPELRAARSIDDEYTPTIFEMLSLAAQAQNDSSPRSFLQWKATAYGSRSPRREDGIRCRSHGLRAANWSLPMSALSVPTLGTGPAAAYKRQRRQHLLWGEEGKVYPGEALPEAGRRCWASGSPPRTPSPPSSSPSWPWRWAPRCCCCCWAAACSSAPRGSATPSTSPSTEWDEPRETPRITLVPRGCCRGSSALSLVPSPSSRGPGSEGTQVPVAVAHIVSPSVPLLLLPQSSSRCSPSAPDPPNQGKGLGGVDQGFLELLPKG